MRLMCLKQTTLHQAGEHQGASGGIRGHRGLAHQLGGIGIGIGILLRCHLSQYHDISLARENRSSPGRASLANLED